jgi:phosphate transport system substrate-binding protein
MFSISTKISSVAILFVTYSHVIATPCTVISDNNVTYSGECKEQGEIISINDQDGDHSFPKKSVKFSYTPPESKRQVECDIETVTGKRYVGKCEQLDESKIKVITTTPSETHILLVKSIKNPPFQNAPSQSETPPTKNTRPNLRFVGSNTLGESLIPKLLDAHYLQLGFRTNLIPDPNTPDDKTLNITNTAQLTSQISIKAPGSSKAFDALSKGNADVGMSSRPINDDENRVLNDLRHSETEHVIGLDGLSIVVNNRSTLDFATKREIAEFFSGNKGNYHIYARDNNSGTYKTFEEMILKPFKQSLATNSERLARKEEIATKVSLDLQGIGFVDIATATGGNHVKILDINECGLKYSPKDKFYLKSEEYPLSRRLFLYHTKDTPDLQRDMINSFINYSLADVGQSLIAQSGFIDLDILVQNEDAKDRRLGELGSSYRALMKTPLADDYLDSTQGAKRLSVTFRFRSNSDELDSRAIRDLERLRTFLKKREYANVEVRLLGFTDSDGGANSLQNRQLAKKRADAIKTQLNLPNSVITKGYAALIPVACNDEEGKAKNRRVEVWIR